uniref:FAS1 domain-containing protein n=1 Tax=Aegilops tauschii subsp. strangulata TaxID=200361 RepID=A0A453RC64_AEGTS
TETLAAASPDFAQFSAALAAANLSAEIDGRSPVTVLAVDNAAVARLGERRLQPDALARVLSLHVLLDYLGDARLRRQRTTPRHRRSRPKSPCLRQRPWWRRRRKDLGRTEISRLPTSTRVAPATRSRGASARWWRWPCRSSCFCCGEQSVLGMNARC